MIMTMEHMYTAALEPIPNPERLDKVREIFCLFQLHLYYNCMNILNCGVTI